MHANIPKGTKVTWNSDNSSGVGKIIEVIHGKASRMINGEQITRDGSNSNPALLVELEEGGQAIKLRSEVEFDR
jgi:hypothetical protein